VSTDACGARKSGADRGWSALAAGDPLTIVKLAPDGAEAARYAGIVVATDVGNDWVVARAVWTHGEVDAAGLRFQSGDILDEWFSPRHDFNAFAVATAEGDFKGWYANVARPARLNLAASPPRLTWRDLYLDVVATPGRPAVVCDEDELAASGLRQGNPRLFRRIMRARAEILDRLARRVAPFAVLPLSPGTAASSADAGDASKTGTVFVHPH
jgi:hypothetical protein